MERREALKWLFGSGGVGLTALATGLPSSFLLRPLEPVEAQESCDAGRAQYLIMSISGAGDPVNANAPGSYDHEDIVHAPDPSMAKAPLLLGSQPTFAAQVWASMPQWVLDRSAFLHHSTLTNNHPNLPKVMRLMGATERAEMLPSIAARHLSGCFGTVQEAPIVAGAGGGFTYRSKNLPDLKPTALRDLLAKDKTPLGSLAQLRDSAVDEIHAVLRQQGTPAQLAYLDSLVQSRSEARTLSDDLLGLLAGITNDQEAGQINAAVALIKMNLTSSVLVKFRFGSDNHTDADLMGKEVPEYQQGVANIVALMQLLEAEGLKDKATFGMMNVFGRTLKRKGLVGRDHWSGHHVSLLIGKNVRAGVVGGLVPTMKKDDYVASGIDSQSGRAAEAGDIKPEETLASVGKTFAASLGLPTATVDAAITQGKIISGALAG